MTATPLSGRTLIFVVACRGLRRALRERLRHIRKLFDVRVYYRVTHAQTQRLILDLIEQKYRAGVAARQIHIFLVTGWHPNHEERQKQFLASDLPYLIYERTKAALPPIAEINVHPIPHNNIKEQYFHIYLAIERFLFEEYFPHYRNEVT